MFVVNPQTNTIESLNKKTFTELGFKERQHLQEWIAANPEALGEKLLIIQKEFSGFSETKERLDLLALDKDGNLVIIENKLDDSGRDVTWQALKYASYCSTLTKEDIRGIFQGYMDARSSGTDATNLLETFFDDTDYDDLNLNQRMTQRIILIAANFRKEVTSTVLWLMNFKIRLQCFKIIPYELEGRFFLSLDQIIPVKDAQDYIISMANKAHEEIVTEEEVKARFKIRNKFWTEFFKAIKGKSLYFQNSVPYGKNWMLSDNIGIDYLRLLVRVSTESASVHLFFGPRLQSNAKLLFDTLFKHKAAIENAFGKTLVWERQDDKIKSQVGYYTKGINYHNEEEWPQIISFLIEHLNKLEKTVMPYLEELKVVIASAPKRDAQSVEEEE